MFKVPAWGSDIPKTNAKFGKKVNAKKTKPAEPNQIQSTTATSKPTKKAKKLKTKTKLLEKIKIESEPQILSPLVRSRSKRALDKLNPSNRLVDLSGTIPNTDISELILQAKKKRIEEQQKPAPESAPSVVPKKSKNELKQTQSLVQNYFGSGKMLPKKSILKQTIDNTNRKKNDKKKKFDDSSNKMLFDNSLKMTYLSKTDDFPPKANIPTKPVPLATKSSDKKMDIKKEKIKQLLDNNRSAISVDDNKLRDRMMERLKAAQFRYLNEKLYTLTGDQAQKIFEADPKAFQTYHQGYQQQVKKWPINPLDVIIKKIEKMPKTYIIADMGCGEAALSRRVAQTVHSFDLVAAHAGVTACDMAHTPLEDASVDVAVYCLALMGTELTKYLCEANRILKNNGHLIIAEVESRFEDINTFTRGVEKLGFKLTSFDKERSVFFFMHFEKTGVPPSKKHKLPQLQLKPCLYKKR